MANTNSQHVVSSVGAFFSSGIVGGPHVLLAVIRIGLWVVDGNTNLGQM